jgi:NTP pyrophosphatase (non-canonical NTP hydrolase)
MTGTPQDAPLSELMRVTRAVSDIYAERCNIKRDEVWHLAKLSEEVGELNAAYLSATGRGRDRGLDADELEKAVADEVADVFAQILLFADANQIDVVKAVYGKWGRYLPQEDT